MKEARRRILALVLPELLCELAERGLAREARAPLGVVLVHPHEAKGTQTSDEHAEPLEPTATLAAVNDAAQRFGVRPGQTLAEANALLSGLNVVALPIASVERALAAVAEAALSFGATVSLEAPDCVWVDVTGSAHLFGGEDKTCVELGSRIRAMGHRVRIAVADGPDLARAFARWSPPKKRGEVFTVIESSETARSARSLPIVALPLGETCRDWLVRLGLLTWGEIANLPRHALTGRLDGEVQRALELVEGRDARPLVPYTPERRVEERVSFEHAIDGVEPLLFVLRGLVARLAARLSGRGEAASMLKLNLEHDRSVARLNSVKSVTELKFSLAAPVFREDELRRVLSARLERVRLSAPVVGVELVAPVLAPAQVRQLELGQWLSGGADAESELPLVLAELIAEVGEDRVGVLRKVDTHRPEAQSALFPVVMPGLSPPRTRRGERARAKPETPRAVQVSLPASGKKSPPTRLLPEPLRLDIALRVGATVPLDRRIYTIERLEFEERLQAVEWWTKTPVARDYLRLFLRSTEGLLEALVYVDRESGKRYLQAVAD
jgi:protein ImuB